MCANLEPVIIRTALDLQTCLVETLSRQAEEICAEELHRLWKACRANGLETYQEALDFCTVRNVKEARAVLNFRLYPAGAIVTLPAGEEVSFEREMKRFEGKKKLEGTNRRLDRALSIISQLSAQLKQAEEDRLHQDGVVAQLQRQVQVLKAVARVGQQPKQAALASRHAGPAHYAEGSGISVSTASARSVTLAEVRVQGAALGVGQHRASGETSRDTAQSASGLGASGGPSAGPRHEPRVALVPPQPAATRVGLGLSAESRRDVFPPVGATAAAPVKAVGVQVESRCDVGLPVAVPVRRQVQPGATRASAVEPVARAVLPGVGQARTAQGGSRAECDRAKYAATAGVESPVRVDEPRARAAAISRCEERRREGSTTAGQVAELESTGTARKGVKRPGSPVLHARPRIPVCWGCGLREGHQKAACPSRSGSRASSTVGSCASAATSGSGFAGPRGHELGPRLVCV